MLSRYAAHTVLVLYPGIALNTDKSNEEALIAFNFTPMHAGHVVNELHK